ncbi:MAG: S41 family peptidase, partial [Armatimonadota bacterium]|nr:S41 family peptidase [Armatimonadota bacterium]
MLSARVRVSLAVLVGLICFFGSARPHSLRAQDASLPPAAAPENTKQDDGKIALVMSMLLSSVQYAHKPFDDAVSSRLLDRYLDALDPQHIYFLQSDRTEFDQWRTTLDDLTKRGDISPAFAIFARFQERLKQRTDWADAALQSQTFTFDGADTFNADRKKLAGPRDLDEAHRLWESYLRYEYLQEKLNKSTPDKIKETLTRRYARSVRTASDLDSDDILELYLDTMAHVYDPHTDYYGKSAAAGFNILINQSLVGIGAQLEGDPDDGYVKIVSLIPGGPALRSKKLKAGDKIQGVGQGASGEMIDIQDMNLNKVVDLIRGLQGTTVRLNIHPAAAPDPATRTVVPLVRQQINLAEQSAKAQIVDLPATTAGGKALRLGVVDLSVFYQDPEKNKSATADVARLLGKLNREHVAGIILDLRDNGGGSLPEAISMAGLFIKRGPMVQIRDQKGRVSVDSDDDPAVAYNGPLIVLTNRLSASASEIVTGALQDYGRALVVGDTSTFGKGTVQTV